MKRTSALSVLVSLFSFLAVSNAHAASTAWQSNIHGSVRVISTWSPKGELQLGLHFKPIPNWYYYWKVPGEAGYPPSVEWTGSRGFQKAEILWPAPSRIILPGPIEEFGYDGETVYPVHVTRTQGSVHVQARVSYLTCYTSCVPYRYTFTLDVPSDQAAEAMTEEAALIRSAIALVPPAGTSDEEVMRKAPVVKKLMSMDMPAPGARSLLWILVLAWVGGLILNVMPCVLPVLSIKLAGLLQHSGQSARSITKSALASAAGIIVSFEALAIVAIVARNAGHAIGWGIQFQNPVFVTFLMMVVLFFALNLWGVFEIQMPRFLGHFATTYGYHETLTAHFVSGLFATLLATPCSAPFLGTAMGLALTQPPLVIIFTFAAVGIGMAMPYLALAVFPKTIHWLPRPGAWMVTLKKGLALLLLATAAWLGWVLYQQHHTSVESASASSEWVTFDEKTLDNYLQAGKPVFVDVTADWCVTCKYNERFVLRDEKVKTELQKRGVVLMRADWTNRDAAIGAYLMKHGRAGIPFYAYYPPGQPPAVLSEFLTVSKVLVVLRKS